MPPTEAKNHRCKAKYQDKIDNTVSKLMNLYLDHGDKPIVEVLSPVKDQIIFRNTH